MQLYSVVALAALFADALAAPVAEPDRNMMVTGSQWTIEKFTRTCNAANTSCKHSYAIDTHSGAATACAYTVDAKNANRASYNDIHCGAFTVSSSWSGQFGAGNGFQTLAVTNNHQIIYPAYTDKQLVNGKTVTPDQSYTPQALP